MVNKALHPTRSSRWVGCVVRRKRKKMRTDFRSQLKEHIDFLSAESAEESERNGKESSGVVCGRSGRSRGGAHFWRGGRFSQASRIRWGEESSWQFASIRQAMRKAWPIACAI